MIRYGSHHQSYGSHQWPIKKRGSHDESVLKIEIATGDRNRNPYDHGADKRECGKDCATRPTRNNRLDSLFIGIHLACTKEQNRFFTVTHNFFSDTAEEPAADTAAAVGRHGDQVDIMTPADL